MNKNDFWQKCKDDIEFFFASVLGITLCGKQIDFAHSMMDNSHTVAVFARQSGKSTTISGCIVHALIFDRKVKVGIYAPTKETAIYVMFQYVVDIFEGHSALMNLVVHDGIRRSGFIKMKNGNSLRAFTASKDSKSVRGYDPTIIVIDESQDITDDMYNDDILPSGAALKGGMVNGVFDPNKATKTKVWEAGTCKGRSHFYETSRTFM